MIDADLLPCPFCGGAAAFRQWLDTLDPNATWIECTGCSVMTDTTHHHDPEHAKRMAAQVWNRRAADNLRISSSAVKVRPIEWGEEQQPNKECGYNHVIGKSPLGDILVTWKGWKDDPYYSTDDWVFGHFGGDSLDEAKQAIQSAYDKIVLSCVIPDGGNVTES